MQMGYLKVRITGLKPLLGSLPMNKEVYSDFIATKAAGTDDEEKAKADVADIEDMLEEKSTGFYRHEGRPVLKGYQLKGFLKEAGKALKDQLTLARAASKIDNFVFIKEDILPFVNSDGEVVEKVNGYLERPLRAETMQGPRVSLARSEKIDDWSFDVTIFVLDNAGTAKSKSITVDVIKELLSYGQFKGLLQWRNAGYGSFKYEVLDEGVTDSDK